MYKDKAKFDEIVLKTFIMPLPLLPIGLSAASLISNLIGQSASSKANKQQMGLVEGQIADLASWHDTEKNRPYLESNVGRSVIEKSLENYRTQNRQVEQTGAITGASDESKIAAKGKLAKGMSDTMSSVAAMGTAREDQIENRYRSNIAQLLGQKGALIGRQGQSGANLSSNAASVLQSYAPLAGIDNPAEAVLAPEL